MLGWFLNQQFDNAPATQITQNQAPAIETTPSKSQIPQKIVKSKQIPTVQNTSSVKDPYSPEVLIANSKIAIKNGEYLKALTHIENVLAQVQNDYPVPLIEKMFLDISELYLQQLGGNNPQLKIDFLNKAVNVLPNELQLRYFLTQLFLSLEKYSQAQYQLNFLADNIKWKSQFDQLQAQLNYAQIFQQGEVEIPLISNGNSWHIDATVDDQSVRLILDTGASITTLGDHLVANNYPQTGRVILSTANGKIEAFQVKLDALVVGTVVKNKFPVVVLPTAKLPDNIDGLLGLDWLTNFDFVIDKKNSILRLSRTVN